MVPSADLDAIKQVHDFWMKNEIDGRHEAILELCTEDVIWIPPDEPAVRGKPAVAGWLKGLQAEIRSLVITNYRIEVCDWLAYKMADYSTTYKVANDPKIKRQSGTHMWVLRKVAGGIWQVAVLMWNLPEGD